MWLGLKRHILMLGYIPFLIPNTLQVLSKSKWYQQQIDKKRFYQLNAQQSL